MSTPLVSICCLTFNHAPYIRDAIDGFLMQKTDFSIEILIHDDASTDGTEEIIREYEHKYPNIIKPLYEQENQWQKGRRGSAVFNFPRAKGKYIALCEGDDYWTDPLKLQKQVEFMEKHPETAFCSHNVNRVNQDGKIIEKADVSKPMTFYTEKEIFHNHFPTLSLVFRNVNLEFPDSLIGVLNGDVVLKILLSSHGGAAHMGFIGGNYRIHPGGVYSSKKWTKNSIKSIQARKLMLKYNLDDWQKKELKRSIRKRKWKGLKSALKRGYFKTIWDIISI